jgi:pimeloyl-ACP methyl ester carboxylesterase
MGRTPLSTLVGFNASINYSDIRADIPKIACPTLVITTDESGLASVEETRAWQRTIPGSELLVIPGNSYHVAASEPEGCATATLDFLARRGAV